MADGPIRSTSAFRDSLFYGFVYDNAPFGAPMRAFYGQVIDMFYLDLWQGTLPNAWPVIGGHSVALWPIFNVADAALLLGAALLLVDSVVGHRRRQPA